MQMHAEASDTARTIWIGDLEPWMNEEWLLQLFSATHTVRSVKVIRNKVTLKPEGYGFIEFSSRAVAQGVLDGLNGRPIPNTEHVFRLGKATYGSRGSTEGILPDHAVFVGDLSPDVTDYLLQETFARHFASVRSSKVITDPLTGRSKGYGFVRFGDERERDRALVDMMGHLICGRPVRVSTASSKKTVPGARYANPPHPSDFDPANTTLFIGGLAANVTEEDLEVLFGRFGDIIYVKIPPGKGCGFVQFVHRPVAEIAMASMQSQVFHGSAIRISWGRSSSASRGLAGVPSSPAAASAFSRPQGSANLAYPAFHQRQPQQAEYSQRSVAGLAAAQDLYAHLHAAYAAQQAALPLQLAAQRQAYQQPFDTSAASGLLQQQSRVASGRRSLPSPLGTPELQPPLTFVDLERLNTAYRQRQQASSFGGPLR